MSYKLFLDDIRVPTMIYPNNEDSDFEIVRTVEEFKKLIKERGLPYFISFDNDLGCDENDQPLFEGYDAAKWLVNESGFDLTDLNFKVHSYNPVAKENIEALLNNYLKFINI